MNPERSRNALAILVGAFLLPVQAEEAAAEAPYHLFNPVPRELMREMSTDRPDLTESPYTVDAGHFQVEADLVNRTRADDGELRSTTTGIGFLNVKIGLTTRVDLQSVFESHIRSRVEAPGNFIERRSGIGDFTTRVKINLWGNDGGPTAGAIMPFVTWPTSEDGLGNDRVTGGVILPLGFELPDAWSLGTMIEIDWAADEAGEGHHVELLNSLTVSRGLTESLGSYVEMVNVVSAGEGSAGSASLDGGLTYGITRDIQVDVGANIGLTNSTDDWTAFLGLSLRR